MNAMGIEPTEKAPPEKAPASVRERLARAARLRARTALLLILIAIGTTRAAGYLVFNDIFAFDRTGVVHGSSAYLTYAENLIATGVYGKSAPGVPDAHLPPLYSYVLAGVWAVFSGGAPSSLVVAVLHTAFDAAAACALFVIASRLLLMTGQPRLRAGAVWVGLLSGLFYAAYPYLLFQNLTLIDTPLFMALLYGFLAGVVVLADVRAGDRRGPVLAVGAGVLLGLLGLARPNAALFALMAGGWLLARVGWRAGLGRLVPMGAAAALVLAPWLVRSALLFGTFVPVALNGGENFYQGNNAWVVPFLRAGYDPQWVPPPTLSDTVEPHGVEANAALAAAGWAFLREHPDAIPGLIGWKFITHWSIDIAPRRNPTEGELPRPDYAGDAVISQDAGGALSIGALPPGDPVGQYSGRLFEQVGRPVHIAYFGGLLVLLLAGVWCTRREWRVVWLLWGVQAVNTVLYVVFHPSTRYRAPTDPLLFVFAAIALVLLAVAVAQRRAARAAASG
jgi:hypothetical protein